MIPRVEIVMRGKNELIIKLDTKQKGVVRAAERGVKKALVNLQTYIKEQLLSGQVLNNRSGNLRRAILIEGEGLRGRVYIGDEAWYGRLHELGVYHEWVIQARNKKALAFQIGGKNVVVARVVHPGLPERSFMRRGLAEQKSEIIETIRAEVASAVQA